MVDIPTLDIEDYDPDLNEEQETVEDKSVNDVCSNRCRSRRWTHGQSLYDMGYTKMIAVNTARSDLNGLDIPESQKFLVDEHGEQGAKDQAKAEAAIERKEQKCSTSSVKFLETTLTAFDLPWCIWRLGGGTVNTLIKVAKKYFTYIGVENVDERVGVFFPSNCWWVCFSKGSENAHARITQLCGLLQKRKDRSSLWWTTKRSKLSKLTVKKFWTTINNTVAGLFHVFNVLANQDSEPTALMLQTMIALWSNQAVWLWVWLVLRTLRTKLLSQVLWRTWRKHFLLKVLT